MSDKDDLDRIRGDETPDVDEDAQALANVDKLDIGEGDKAVLRRFGGIRHNGDDAAGGV